MTTKYELSTNAPAPMPREEYFDRVQREWQSLVNDRSLKESDYHSFIEKHPSMLVPTSEQDSRNHKRSVLFGAVFTKPPLQNYTRRIPDFGWVAFNSVYVTATLVEIETPAKRWFTKKGIPHSDLVQAQHQLTDWRDWWASHRDDFVSAFRVKEYFHDYSARTLDARFVLVHGSRNEFSERPEISRQRGALERDDETLMTFERLPLGYGSLFLLTARWKSGKFEVVHVPPTFMVGPLCAAEYLQFTGFEAAVDNSEWMQPARRDFLKERWGLWREFARAKERPMVVSSGLE